MTNDETIAVLLRMRELLANPDRVVLNPYHYFENKPNGEVVELSWDQALKQRDTCRVCFCGAATLAVWEILTSVAGYGSTRDYDYNANDDPDEDVRRLLALKIGTMSIPEDKEVWRQFSGETAMLTNALKQGRAVDVVDAVISDLRELNVA